MRPARTPFVKQPANPSFDLARGNLPLLLNRLALAAHGRNAAQEIPVQPGHNPQLALDRIAQQNGDVQHQHPEQIPQEKPGRDILNQREQ